MFSSSVFFQPYRLVLAQQHSTHDTTNAVNNVITGVSYLVLKVCSMQLVLLTDLVILLFLKRKAFEHHSASIFGAPLLCYDEI